MSDASLKASMDLTCARAVMAETQTLMAEAQAIEIQMREHVRHLGRFIAETHRAVETSRRTLQRCPTLGW